MVIFYLWFSTILSGLLFSVWRKDSLVNLLLKSTLFAGTILGVVNLFKYYN